MENIEFSLIIAQIINFGILFYLFQRFLSKRLNSLIYKRRELITKLEHIDSDYEEMIQKAKGEQKDILEKARKKAQDFMRESEHIAKLKAEKIRKRAHNDAMSILDSGKRDVEKERVSMLSAMKEKIIDISLRINEKMFTGEKASKEFIQEELDDIK